MVDVELVDPLPGSVLVGVVVDVVDAGAVVDVELVPAVLAFFAAALPGFGFGGVVVVVVVGVLVVVGSTAWAEAIACCIILMSCWYSAMFPCARAACALV